MKKLFTISIAIFLFFISASSVYAACGDSITGGAGTVGDPYQIDTAGELAAINNCLGAGNSGKYFKQMADIDLNIAPYNTGTGWTPIGNSSTPFYGKFNGDYKTISGLFINDTGSWYKGLFGYASGSGVLIENVILENINVTGGQYMVAGLVGYLHGSGTVQNSGVDGGTISGLMRLGGLVGSNEGTVQRSFSKNVTITQRSASSDCCVGGLIGATEFGGSTNNSYSHSNVVHTSSGQGSLGGIIGSTYNAVSMSYLYSKGSITTLSSFPSNVGGLIGNNYVSATNSYWDTQTSGQASSASGTGKTTLQMKEEATYTGWDFSTVWDIDGVNNDGYPFLQWEDITPVDSTPPTVSSVSSDTANGTYNVDDVIDIDVTFSEAVTSTGNVTITLETGSTDRTCTFTVSSSTTGTCNYTVQAGDSSLDLTVKDISGTIKDAANNAMSNYVPTTNLADNKAIVIDTTDPVLTEVTPVSTPGTDTTPSYTFSTTEAGVISYGGSCSSDTIVAAVGSNTISFSTLTDGTYSNCTITVTENSGNVSNILSVTSFTIDTSSPVISSVSTSVTTTTATISWTTNESSTTYLSYGLTNSYGTTTDEIGTLVTSHSVSLSGLSCGTTYNFKAYSEDGVLNTGESSNTTFITSSCPGVVLIPSVINPVVHQSSIVKTVDVVKPIESKIITKSGSGTKSISIFSNNLYLGVRNDEVLKLQKFLNSNGYLVAISGPGSLGNETNFFGRGTKDALSKFQKDKGVRPSFGFFGPTTRAIVNNIQG